ncbi:MAG TPA: glycosyltransferase [Vitreimonas sp.]|uniref:glycosyltransferase n=1 Tax=Vitreimonas sp. TaxID=3069702 RepID=UPI002D5929F0|nr:glycosyltransferase [Vitreimonas sp.]HYD85972.1 glycosyltransferase [Vitreimonas sp.]
MNAPRSFLLATWEGGGSVPPVLDLARRLAERGHHVRVMSDACNRPESEAAGARFIAWTRAPSKPQRSREFDTWDDWSQANPAEGFANLMQNVLVGPALAFAQDLSEELRREPADLVVSSEMLFGVHMGCEALGQRHVLLGVNIPLFPLPGFIPLGPGLKPARTVAERALHAEAAAMNEAMLAASLPELNAARAALNLAPIARMLDQHGAADAQFIATARAFDFAPATLPAKICYVGPLLGEPAWAGVWRSPYAAGDRRPLALVSFSTTFQNHAGVLQRVIDAIATLPMKAVVTLGGSIGAEELRVADNVQLLASAPHSAVLSDAAIAVTHGGHGTVMKALAAGKPLIILPHGRDQEDNAVRVTERGAGLRLDRDADTEAIRAALSKLLLEPAYAHAAEALGAAIRREIETSPLLAKLEALASTGERVLCR